MFVLLSPYRRSKYSKAKQDSDEEKHLHQGTAVNTPPPRPLIEKH